MTTLSGEVTNVRRKKIRSGQCKTTSDAIFYKTFKRDYKIIIINISKMLIFTY